MYDYLLHFDDDIDFAPMASNLSSRADTITGLIQELRKKQNAVGVRLPVCSRVNEQGPPFSVDAFMVDLFKMKQLLPCGETCCDPNVEDGLSQVLTRKLTMVHLSTE